MLFLAPSSLPTPESQPGGFSNYNPFPGLRTGFLARLGCGSSLLCVPSSPAICPLFSFRFLSPHSIRRDILAFSHTSSEFLVFGRESLTAGPSFFLLSVASGQYYADVSQIPFRDPDHFIAANLIPWFSEFWEDIFVLLRLIYLLLLLVCLEASLRHGQNFFAHNLSSLRHSGYYVSVNYLLFAPWHTKSRGRTQNHTASKAAFLENFLAVSTWILDGSSIECHEKKRQRFSLSVARFGSRVFDLEAIQISGAVENELFILDSF